MNIVSTLKSEFSDIASMEEATQLVMRLLLAGLLGGVLGFERECRGKAAGLRTHVMLSMGTAFFVMVPALAGMKENGISRVLQGILTGLGFIGAGTILKHPEEGRVEGLTTAAGMWFAAAVGAAVGVGRGMSAILGTLIGLGILAFTPHSTKLSGKKNESDQETRRVA